MSSYGLQSLGGDLEDAGAYGDRRTQPEESLQLGVDHIDYQVNPRVEKKFMYQALVRCGSTAIPMHMALFNLPLTIAVRFIFPWWCGARIPRLSMVAGKTNVMVFAWIASG